MLVTCALPYSNGPIHIGHMLEHIQADIWVRYKRMLGHEVWFICADDTHGTAIMMKSKEYNISSEDYIAKVFENHKLDFKNFNISYNNYYYTHSKENLYFVRKIYYKLKLKNLISIKNVQQLYDVKENMFLPDRFVQGMCPICYAKNQYGDTCEICGSCYKSIELINPISNISYTKPIVKSSTHIFLNLSILQGYLYNWICSGVLSDKILNKVKEWFTKDLKSWNISRDLPYFGFLIPDMLDKCFYVWLDAPIAYISVFKNLCNKNLLLNFGDFWKYNSDTELYHFIGKDIIYFHSLFWPVLLYGINFRKPNKIFVHGHVTVNGKKLSKSKSNFITASKWMKFFDSDSLRYFYASKLSSSIEDIEMNIQEFICKINSDIVNKVVNLASRSASFLQKYFNNVLSAKLEDVKLYNFFVTYSKKISNLFEMGDFKLVIVDIIKLSDIANQYINDKKPWGFIIKKKNIKLQEICSMGINLFRIIMVFLKPIVPDLAKRSEIFLIDKLQWNSISIPLLNHRINCFKPLYNRINNNVLNNYFK
ncbi:methionine--tRNA ligase [Buchnera aphidicola]|uniref:methionine--tRNA ligase n=1 Tax=Buchnera aphidicola TaxID=9 RepID=UPI0034639274